MAQMEAERAPGAGGGRSRFRLAESTCAGCAADISGALSAIPGVSDVRVLPATSTVVVEHDPQLSLESLRRQAARAGVGLIPAPVRRAGSGAPWWRQPKLYALASAILLLVTGLVAEHLADATVAADAAYLAALVVGGFYTAKAVVISLQARRVTISTLLVAAIGAVILGLYEQAAVLAVVFSLGQVLEEYASGRVRNSLRALMDLAPPVASRLGEDGGLIGVPVEDLVPGDTIMVRPGERIPTDGMVAAGTSAVDQSPITGEPIPVEVTAGSSVFAGTVNGSGALTVTVAKPYADTTLARIIREVEEAQASKGRSQRFADRFGAIYAPAMLGLAAVVAVIPPLITGDWRQWFYRSLVVLVVSCSCALLISVPTAVVTAIARAARDGILIKGGAQLEALGTLRVLAFDKTGTLTRGVPELLDIIPLRAGDPEELLRLAASVEDASGHPLAEAVLTAARRRGLRWPAAHTVTVLPGRGVQGIVGGRAVYLGRPEAGGLPASAAAQLGRLEDDAKTAVMLTVDGQPAALLAVADQMRPEAPQAVAALHRAGIRPVLMLTGDNDRVAAAVAAHGGLDGWRAALLPHDKTEAVTSLRAEHGAIAMVGDGVNDAPALATADVGIAMGAIGTDVALETADVALMADDLAKLPQAIALSRRARRVIRQNITMSVAGVAVLVTAALAGWLSLTAGLLLNEGTALFIIANALRLARPSRRDKEPAGPTATAGTTLAAAVAETPECCSPAVSAPAAAESPACCAPAAGVPAAADTPSCCSPATPAAGAPSPERATSAQAGRGGRNDL
jgi:Cd2+/Zn2+-exporting ATPase